MRRYASAIVSRHCACRSIIHDLEVNNLTTPYALSPSLQVHGNPARTIDAPTRGNHAIAAKFMPFVFHDLLKNPQEKRRLAAPWSRFATAARSTGRSSTFHPDVRIKTRHYFAKGSEIFHWNIFDHATNSSLKLEAFRAEAEAFCSFSIPYLSSFVLSIPGRQPGKVGRGLSAPMRPNRVQLCTVVCSPYSPTPATSFS